MCGCGQSIKYSRQDDSNCDMACTGLTGEKCGSLNYISVYLTNLSKVKSLFKIIVFNLNDAVKKLFILKLQILQIRRLETLYI